VVEAVMADHVIAVVTQQLLDELAAVLVRPKFRRWFSLADAVAFVEALGGKADLRPEPETTAPRRSRDPADDYLIALAETAEAMLITGDNDLLDLDLQPSAITPRQLLEELRRNSVVP
jgi:putative PIN family toxin of toxin-antitoxin system